MSQAEEYDPPSRRDSNNATPRSSQNKSKILEATMRNVPKLKELNYIHWKNVITNSIKNAKLWGYVDGSIGKPSEEDASDLATYFDEAGAVLNAILGSLESGAQRYIEEALDPRDAWVTLEKKYLTAEADTDSKLVAESKQLADLRLEEGGDMIEHIAEFCRMRSQLSGTRFALDDQASLSILYRSLPTSYRQLAVTSEGSEMKDFGALCARLSYLSQNPELEAPVDVAPAEDYTNWGIPCDLKTFGLTGDKNPLLAERASITCRDCLLTGHKAGTSDCPQNEWRKELWGIESNGTSLKTENIGRDSLAQKPMLVNAKRLSYEFSEPIKVVLDFDEFGFNDNLRENIRACKYLQPTLIQQCAILPILQGRNALIQAPTNNGETTTLALSILQIINTRLPYAQALVLTPTNESATAFEQTVKNLGSGAIRCFVSNSSGDLVVRSSASLAQINNYHIFVGTTTTLLRLVRQGIIDIRKLKTLALDDIDKLASMGAEDQILEIYRRTPSLAQVVASSTENSLLVAKAAIKLLVDPVKIIVHRDEGISIGDHFYVMAAVNGKPSALKGILSNLGTGGTVVACRDFTEITEGPWQKSRKYYYLQDSMGPGERGGTIQEFTSKLSVIRSRNSNRGHSYGRYHNTAQDPVSTVVLMTTDVDLSALRAQLPYTDILVNYDIPNNVEDYIKRLDQWHWTGLEMSPTIITFVTSDTNEIGVIQDLERYYGVHVAELPCE